jgi:hypothetical protein
MVVYKFTYTLPTHFTIVNLVSLQVKKWDAPRSSLTTVMYSVSVLNVLLSIRKYDWERKNVIPSYTQATQNKYNNNILGKFHIGWLGEFVKKIAQNIAKHIYVKINTVHDIFRGKSTPKSCAIFKKTAQCKQLPKSRKWLKKSLGTHGVNLL